MDDELRRAFERRADRSAVRGSGDVLAAAHRDADAVHRSGARLPGAIGVAALTLALVVAGLALRNGGGSTHWSPSPPARAPGIVIAQNASALVGYVDCAAVLDDIKDEALERVGPYGLGQGPWHGYFEGGGFRLRGVFPDGFSALQPGAAQVDGSPVTATSGTNTQEVDIDEPDLVETDGDRLFDVRNGVLRVVDIERARVTSTTPLGLVNLLGATLVGESLVVYANEPLSNTRASGDARVVVVDVRGTPAIRQRLTIDGSIVDARVVDGRVHVVTLSAPSIELTFPSSDGGEVEQDAATEANKERIRASTLADWLPSRVVTDAAGAIVAGPEQLTRCADVRHPKEFSGFDQTSLVTLDLDDLARSTSTSVQASTLLVYGSADSIYTATTTYPDVDPDSPAQTPRFIGSDTTDVHRFAIGDVPEYAGSGRVDGYVGDQFGLSEHDGHLRVASTTFESERESRVTVLRIAEGELVETGVVKGLGPGEQLEGVRFIGDLGYVVTFRLTDPLYVVDLRDPSAPVLAGELEIPGFSAYLHPVGDGLLLGVGFDGTEEGRLGDAAASLFDVRDPAAPRRIDLKVFEDRAPRTNDDHHAFTWWSESGTAYFPTGTFSSGNRVEVVRVAEGRLVVGPEIEPGGAGAPPRADFDRIVVVGDQLVSVSPEGVQVNDRASLTPVAWIAYR